MERFSGFTIAPMANGAIPMCDDLTSLNKGPKGEIYPSRKVNEMLLIMVEASVY